jgi:hypothetical protein
MSSFSKPGTGGDRLDYETVNGALLLFTVHGVKSGIPTAFGDKDAVEADVAVLDGPHKGDVYNDCLVFPLVLQGQLRGLDVVLGRLGQGVPKPGQKPPWRLTDPTEADELVGERYLTFAATQAQAEEEPF